MSNSAAKSAPPKRDSAPYLGDLRQAFAQRGCPICRLLATSADRHLDAVLWEMVLDRQLRAEVNEARGYCQQHGWLLDRVGAALGTAILTRGTIKTLLDALAEHPVERSSASILQSLRQSLGAQQASGATEHVVAALTPVRPCPVCKLEDSLSSHLIRTLVVHVEGQDGLADAYQESDGLCQSHFRQALARAPSTSTARLLVDAQQTVWQRLYDELGEFIRKKDFKHQGEAFGPERDSWRRALEAICGPPPRRGARD